MKAPQLIRKAHKQALKTQKRAHVPYSKFHVGAAIVSRGEIFSGCNIENASYGATVCAERVAVLKAVSEGFKTITDVVVVAPQPVPPCALCLQVLSEFCKADTKVWLGDRKGLHEQVLFCELYPRAFDPAEFKRALRK